MFEDHDFNSTPVVERYVYPHRFRDFFWNEKTFFGNLYNQIYSDRKNEIKRFHRPGIFF